MLLLIKTCNVDVWVQFKLLLIYFDDNKLFSIETKKCIINRRTRVHVFNTSMSEEVEEQAQRGLLHGLLASSSCTIYFLLRYSKNVFFFPSHLPHLRPLSIFSHFSSPSPTSSPPPSNVHCCPRYCCNAALSLE